MILDDGPTAIGLESTIVDLSRPDARLLRPGGLTVEEIEAVTGPLAGAEAAARRAHRACWRATTRRHCRFAWRPPRSRPTRRCWPSGRRCRRARCKTLNLSAAGDLTEAAANLFAYLRRLDASGARGSR